MDIRKIFGKSEIDLRDINAIIFHWNQEKFQCKVVSRAWDLIAGFVLWMVWKERNHRIFQDKAKDSEIIWKRVVSLMRETILVEKWDVEDWKANQTEEMILNSLNLKYEMVYHKQGSRHSARAQNPDNFIYPRDNFIKLNFDGASKGNPGNDGFGGIFRDSQKQVRWIYAEWGGEMTNNEAELWAIHQGLRIAIRNGYTSLEIVGDSQIAIEILKKLSNGRDWERITSSWRTAGIVQEIAGLLRRIDYKLFYHVRRNGNHAADFLANWGCKGRDNMVDSQWKSICANRDWLDLATIINEDHEQATRENVRRNELGR